MTGGWAGVLRRLVLAPAVVGLTALMWVTLPAWLIVAAVLSPLLPGRWRALRLLWVVMLYLTCEALLLVVLLGLWFSSGFGRRVRTPYFEGIHYDLVQGVMWVFFREARRAPLRASSSGRCTRRSAAGAGRSTRQAVACPATRDRAARCCGRLRPGSAAAAVRPSSR